MEAVSIRNDSKETYTVAEVDTNETRPSLRADLQRRGFDGSIYALDRVLTGRKKPRRVWCYKTKGGEFVTL